MLLMQIVLFHLRDIRFDYVVITHRNIFPRHNRMDTMFGYVGELFD